jgi:hypothetical protein
MQYLPRACTFFEYLQSPRFSFKGYLNTLYHVAFVLHEAQLRQGFIHWDLNPWNILLDSLAQPISLDYLYTDTQCMRIETTLNPILIDFEKSHTVDVVTGWHHGQLHPMRMNFVQDVLTLLVSSLAVVLGHQNLGKRELGAVMKLAGFFENTAFTKHAHFKTVSELRVFLAQAKKYEFILTAPQDELRDKTAYDFICFLHDHFEFTSTTTPLKSGMRHTPLATYCALTSTTNPVQEWVDACDVEHLDVLTAVRLYNRLHQALPEEHALLSRLQELIDHAPDVAGLPELWRVLREPLPQCTGDVDAVLVPPAAMPYNWNELKLEVQWYLSHFENARYQLRRWSDVLRLPSTRVLTVFAHAQTMHALAGKSSSE